MPPRKRAAAATKGVSSTPPPAKKKPAGAGKRKKAAETVSSDDEPAKPRKKRGKSTRASKNTREPSVEEVEAPDEDMAIPWQNKEYHALTDGILLCIEEDNGMRCGLGFDPQGALVVRGVPQASHHRKLAEKVVLKHPDFKKMEPKKASQAVKNRIDKLKKAFFAYKNQLSDTGEGVLPLDDGDGQLPEGHEYKNLYEKILGEFPWYWRMRCLLNRSPIYDRSAVVHSGSELDLDFMLPKSAAAKTNNTADGAATTSDNDEPSASSDDDSSTEVKPSVKGPAASATARAASAPVKSRTRATPMEQLSTNLDRSEQRRAEQLQAIIKAKEKADERKNEAKAEMQIKLAQLKYEAKAQQAQAQRDHEFRMAQLQLGIHSSQLAPPPTSGPTSFQALPLPSAAPSLPAFSSPLDHALGIDSSPLSTSFASLPLSVPSGASTPSSLDINLDNSIV